MKILWLSHIIPYPPKGGLLQRSYNLLKQTAKRHEVHLVSLNQKKILQTRNALEQAENSLKNICNRLDIFPIKSDKSKLHWATMTALSYFSTFPYDVNWFYNKDMMAFMDKLAKLERYDLIHIDTLGLFPYALLFSNVPYVLNHHNIESHMMSVRFNMEKNNFKKMYFKREAIKLREYECNVCKKSAMNLVVSDLDSLRLKEVVGEVDVTVVQNGVDLEYFTASNYFDRDDGGLVFAGGMSYYPNREAVLYFISEIWPLLREDNINRRVTIIGRNPPTELLRIAQHSNIIVPGYVEDVRPYISSAKIYICPIKNGGGTRLKILDALAMGKPLVATGFAVEGLDLVEEEQYLRAENASEFKAQIIRLENDSKLCLKLALAGRQFVTERYSWDIIGVNIEEAYQKAVNN